MIEVEFAYLCRKCGRSCPEFNCVCDNPVADWDSSKKRKLKMEALKSE